LIENIQHIEIEIDKITNSIENAISGDNFRTNVSLVVISDFKSIKKKNGWIFNWENEFNQADRDVYKLTIEGNPQIIQ